jgi:quercetin dioxygenase-like cupin family protein
MNFKWIAAAALLGCAVSTSALAFEPIISLPGAAREIHPDGVTDAVLATKEQTDGQLGMVILGSPPGTGPGPAIIDNKAADYFYVLDGTFEFHIGDKVFDGGPGTLVASDKGTSHGYIAKTEGHMLVIFAPGGYEHFFMDWDKQGLKPGPDLGKLENQYGVTRP